MLNSYTSSLGPFIARVDLVLQLKNSTRPILIVITFLQIHSSPGAFLTLLDCSLYSHNLAILKSHHALHLGIKITYELAVAIYASKGKICEVYH